MFHRNWTQIDRWCHFHFRLYKMKYHNSKLWDFFFQLQFYLTPYFHSQIKMAKVRHPHPEIFVSRFPNRSPTFLIPPRTRNKPRHTSEIIFASHWWSPSVAVALVEPVDPEDVDVGHAVSLTDGHRAVRERNQGDLSLLTEGGPANLDVTRKEWDSKPLKRQHHGDIWVDAYFA